MSSITQFFSGLSILYILLVFTPLYGQNTGKVRGLVVDEESKEALIGVTVVVDESDGVITDIDGKYVVELLPGEHTLKFTYIGYESITKKVIITVGETRKMDILLVSISQELGPVVVTASQYEKSVAEETVSMDVLSSDLIKNTNSRDLAEVVGKTPGVLVQDGQISIRGGSSYSYGIGTRTAVLLDGLGYASADLGEAQLKTIPLENIDQVEVIKGASSVVYGSSALNGVVNVRTAWPGAIPETQISMYSGFYDKPPRPELKWWENRLNYNVGFFASHQRKIKNLQLVVGGNFDKVNSFLEDNDEIRGRGNIKTRYVLPKNPKISFGVNANMMKEVSDRFFIAQDLDTNAYRIAQGSDDDYLRTSVDPHFTYIDEKGNRFTFQSRYLNIFRVGNGDDPNAVSNSFEINPQYQKNWNNMFILTTGIPFTIGFSRSNLYTGKRRNRSAAGYAQGEFKYGNLSLVAGIRYEFNSVDTLFETSIPVVRTGLNYKVGKATFIRGSWGQAYRLPSVAERFIANELVSVGILPNPDLTAESGWSAEIGIKQGIKIGKWGGFFDFATYWMNYDDFVEYRFGVHDNFAPNGEKFLPEYGNTVFGLKPFNVEQARIFGWEASIAGQGTIGPVEIQTLIGYTYSYPGNNEDSLEVSAGEFIKDAFKNFAKRIESDSEINEILQFRVRHLVRGDISLTYKKWSIGYSLYYASFPEKIPDLFVAAMAVIDGGQNTLGQYIEDHQNGDLVMDARLYYDINDLLRVGFITKNLTNKEYSTRPGRLEPPRSYTLQVRVTF